MTDVLGTLQELRKDVTNKFVAATLDCAISALKSEVAHAAPVNTVVIDIDGTIATYSGHDGYSTAVPVEGAVESIRALVASGRRIVLYTSRGMRRHPDDFVNHAPALRMLTEAWLRKWNIPYHELVLGKPVGCIYIDDKGHRFTDWESAFEAALFATSEPL